MTSQVMPAPLASLAADPVAVAVQLPAVAGVAGVHGGRTGRARGIAVLVVGAGAAGAYYKNCDAARAAGAAPVHAGDPGYSRKLDRDGDGVGCE